MIIGIDGNEANVLSKVGISQYAAELLFQFSKASTSNYNFRIYLKDRPNADLPAESETWKYSLVKPQKLWTQIGLPLRLYLERDKPNVFFSPTHYAPRFSPVPTVISIMDLSYEFFPELFNKDDLYQLKNWTRYSARNAAKILTISEASKNDIIKLYGVPDTQIVVTHLGIRQDLEETAKNISMDVLKEKYGVSKPYILFVGTLQPRKNIERLIQAFGKLKNENQELSSYQLVVIGKKGWMYESILDAPKKYEVSESVTFLDFVSDADLPSFYKHAECFVLPSLYEGFGLPVLEAMRYDCPVVTSNVSSLPEAGGDAAEYFNPEEVDDIAKQIKKVITNKELQKNMLEKGRKQIKKFSWEETAKKTLSVLQEVAK